MRPRKERKVWINVRGLIRIARLNTRKVIKRKVSRLRTGKPKKRATSKRFNIRQNLRNDYSYTPGTPRRFGIGSSVLGLVGREPTNFGFTAYDRLSAVQQVRILRSMRANPLEITLLSARSPGATYGDQNTRSMAGIQSRTLPTGVRFGSTINAENITLSVANEFAYLLYRNVIAVVPQRADVYVFYLEGNHFRDSEVVGRAIQYRGVYMILMTQGATPLTFQHELGHILNFSLGQGFQDDIYPDPESPGHSIRPRNILLPNLPPGNPGFLFTVGQQVKFYLSPLLRRIMPVNK